MNTSQCLNKLRRCVLVSITIVFAILKYLIIKPYAIHISETTCTILASIIFLYHIDLYHIFLLWAG
jgi:hypothetical protein